jgi:hypothetical protein
VARVFPDTNVLYPISLADLILRLGDVAFHEVVWSEDLLAEAARVLTEHKGLPAAKAAYFCDCVRDAFPEGEVRRATYEHLIETMTGGDADDHPHAAAASAGATVLLTFNVSDFPADDVGDVRVVNPDDYLVGAVNEEPLTVLDVLRDMGAQRREPQPVEQTLTSLERAGCKQFTALVRAMIE